MSDVRTVFVLICLLAVAGAVAGLFVVDFGDSEPDPADFEETVSLGLTLDDELRLEAEAGDVSLPRVQVFYSQYPYVVGYYGIEQFVTAQQDPAHEQRFGFPQTVYVTTYDGSAIELTAEGYPSTEQEPEWYTAEDAYFVIGSDAATPAGETVIPFAEQDEAESFATEYGGSVHSWEAVLEKTLAVDDAAAVRERVDDRQRSADALLTESAQYLDRPETVVVGDDEPTIQAAIDAASPETTVVVPDGQYDENLEIDKSITLKGIDRPDIVGDWNGTVINVTTDSVAIDGFGISGVGSETPGAAATDGHDHDHGSASEASDVGDDGETESWDADIEDDYATGDAAIATDEAAGLRIQNITINTQASGIILRDSPDTVVTDVTVHGNPDHPIYAHMGIVAMRSPGVVQNSTFLRGLDGVYTHQSNGIVVRNNTMRENRMGIHMMHTSGALLADNTITDSITEGIFVMTGPQRNGLVGNEIRNTPTAIDVGGTDSYIAENKLLENGLALQIDTASTIVERNLIADNRFGAGSRAMLPTNRVVENDFVGNENHISSSTGPVRIWTYEDRGNYWGGAVGIADGETLDRQYSPTASIDSQLHRTDGTPTLAQAPALDALGSFEESVSGMREGEILDTAPLCKPVHEDWLESNGWTELEPTC